MLSVLAFLSEPYFNNGKAYLSNKASINFIKDCFDEPVICIGRVVKGNLESPSAVVDTKLFEDIPNYESIVDFAKQCLTSPKFLYLYLRRCESILDKYPNSKIWVRNPSIGCLIFSLLALRRKRSIYNHMCANAFEAWDNPKYRGITRGLAFIFSRFLKYLTTKVVKNSLTINLCTGDELLRFCEKHNASSHLMIDSTLDYTLQEQHNFPIDIGQIKFTFIGRIQRDKGIEDLIRVFDDLDEKKFKLDIIGRGELFDKLSACNLKGNIKFLGQMDNRDIGKALLQTNVVVVPSKNKYEGFPRVILEAWSCGLPVIVSNVGGINAFVEDKINGLIVKPDDIEDLKNAIVSISDPQLYVNLRAGSERMKLITTKQHWVNRFRSITHD
ncbi:Glycos_transf_1 domain-containing protein [Vibrio chagasii]|nr:Glycos_transf_1 domain-containing protein [Vibrio chagasii]CAH7167247.1 Glycos_transf_1 domain-containing protein [Vibrio chagasii]CAH7358486.1 Glycos_transf_1 domain-containing protein [Vibrio chagasii]